MAIDENETLARHVGEKEARHLFFGDADLLGRQLPMYFCEWGDISETPFLVLRRREAEFREMGDTAFVQFYGLRCAFIAVMIATFLWLRNLDAMRWIALVGSPIPLADAWLAWQSSAPTFTIGRHIAIAIYIFVAFVVLSRQAKGARV